MSNPDDLILAFETTALAASLISNYRLGRKPKGEDFIRCACKHKVNYHDEGGCHAQVSGKPIKYDAYNEPTAWEKVRCSCRRFVGPNSTYDPGLDADLARAQKAAEDSK